MKKEDILKGESYVVDCLIHLNEKDRKSGKPIFTDKGDGIVSARLHNYSIIPIEIYNDLKNSKHKLTEK